MLSVAIITFNEELNLERTLESVKLLAQEIVIVDSYSTDKTVEIARAYGARVFQREFDGFSSQKNYLLDQCSGEFILLIDADEEISKNLAEEIESEMKNPGAEIYEAPFISYCFGKPVHYGGWSGFSKIRLFRKGAVRFGEEKVHERFIFQPELRVSCFRAVIYHHTYQNLSQSLEKMNRYSTSSAKQLFEKGKRASFLSLVFSPISGFCKGYFLKLGFLDGFRGLVLAVNNAHYHFSKYAKLRLMGEEDQY